MGIATRIKNLNTLGFKTFRLPRKRKKHLKKVWGKAGFDWRDWAKLIKK